MPPKNINQHASKDKPGVSGKSKNQNWINLKELDEQEDFIDRSNMACGESDNLHGRRGLDDQVERSVNIEEETYSDRRIHDAIVLALKRNPETDVSEVSLTVSKRNVVLEGTVNSPKAKRAIEAIVRNVQGVKEVFNVIDDTIH